jgi:hypothetical protein
MHGANSLQQEDMHGANSLQQQDIIPYQSLSGPPSWKTHCTPCKRSSTRRKWLQSNNQQYHWTTPDLTGYPRSHNVATTRHISPSGLSWSTNLCACSGAEARSHHTIDIIKFAYTHCVCKCSMGHWKTCRLEKQRHGAPSHVAPSPAGLQKPGLSFPGLLQHK